MPELLKTCLIVCPLVFLAGFVDSIAGGGGLISLPAYLFVGLPVHLASGTNKVVTCMGTAAAAGKYIKSGRVKLKYALIAAAFALAGSVLGTHIALYLNERTLKTVILCVLPAAAVVLAVNRDFGRDRTPPRRDWSNTQELLLCAFIGLVMGCYDGMIGPGTGTFTMLMFSLVIGMDLLTASGCTKVSNLSSNVASAIVWLINGDVLLPVVIPAAICSILGNLTGAKFAIKGGSKRIRCVSFIVLGLLFVKLIIDALA